MKATADTFVKPVPVIVTVVPVTPDVGEKAVTVWAIRAVEAEKTTRSMGNNQRSMVLRPASVRTVARLKDFT